MSQTVIDRLRAARGVSTPLVAITTPDPDATVAALVRAFSEKAPMLQHDLIRGLIGLNEAGVEARAAIVPDDGVMPAGSAVLTAPAEMLARVYELPAKSIVIVHLASALLDNAAVVQGVCNLRDEYKTNHRTLVLVDVTLPLPERLRQDVMVIDEPLPTEAQIGAIIEAELVNAQAMSTPPTTPDATTKARAVAALTGLAAFPVEQAVAISLLSGSLDPDQLWERKRQLIDATKGLSMDRSVLTFDMLGGLDAIKRHFAQIYAGPEPPTCTVRIDEIEKMMGGSAGDTSGTSQDQKGVILREMEANEWTGLIAVGPPGSGKTAISEALGNTYGAPTFAFDLGEAKSKFVGSSEELVRNCMKIIKGVAGKRAYFFATCNNITSGVITPDLLRRFTDGIYYFDLCTAEEKAAIWPIHLARYGHALDAPRPNDAGWTGAEIRNCCRLAYRRRLSLVEAAKSIVPVSVSSPAAIEALRAQADGRFLSASYEGKYRHEAGKRKVAPPTPAMPDVPSFALPGRSYGES